LTNNKIKIKDIMGRPKRIEYENAFYHVMSHGNGRQWIYKSEEHLKIFIESLEKVVTKYKVKIHCFVLMRNYYHILLETPLGNLSDIMLMFNREFARMYNKLENRKGSVFKQRYKAILIEKEEYYLNVLRYISQNPIRPRLCSKIMTL
jgi:REP element-mobilizing transposase RayT